MKDEHPYLAARREWNERYGSYVAAAQHWRLTAMVAMAMAFGGTGYALYQAGQVRLVPYIVEVDRLGTPVMAGFASQIDHADARVVRAMLGAFVTSFRSVTPDAVVQKQYIDRTYALLLSTDPSTQKVNAWFRGANPFERARDGTVSVEVNSIVALSPNSYQVDWTEFERDRQGKQTGTRRIRGIASVTLSPPMDEATIRLNPIGLYVRDFDWTTQL